MPTYYIYALADPATKQIRYVGMSESPDARYHQHICHARIEGSRMAASEWIGGLLRSGAKPKMVILEKYETKLKSDAMDVENQWIVHCLQKGDPLLNRKVKPVYRRYSHILPGRQPTLHLDEVRGWYYAYDE